MGQGCQRRNPDHTGREEYCYFLAVTFQMCIRDRLSAVADVDALIIRSDKVTAEVIEAARNLKIVVLSLIHIEMCIRDSRNSVSRNADADPSSVPSSRPDR